MTVHKQISKYLIPAVKYGGGSLMLLGFFGPGALVKVNGIMNLTKYQDMVASA
jgi:hypothetical protein